MLCRLGGSPCEAATEITFFCECTMDEEGNVGTGEPTQGVKCVLHKQRTRVQVPGTHRKVRSGGARL